LLYLGMKVTYHWLDSVFNIITHMITQLEIYIIIYLSISFVHGDTWESFRFNVFIYGYHLPSIFTPPLTLKHNTHGCRIKFVFFILRVRFLLQQHTYIHSALVLSLWSFLSSFRHHFQNNNHEAKNTNINNYNHTKKCVETSSTTTYW